MSQVFASNNDRTQRKAGGAAMICQLLAFGLAPAGVLFPLLAVVAIVCAIVAATKGRRVALAAIPIAMACGLFGILAQMPTS